MCQKVKGLMGIICQASKIASQETKKTPIEKLKRRFSRAENRRHFA
jgi:hypothetical protein